MISLESLFNEEIKIDYTFMNSDESHDLEFRDILKINKEIDNQVSRSSEGVIGAFLSGILILLEKVINFIAKCIIFITKTVMGAIKVFIGFFNKRKRIDEKKIKKLEAKLKKLKRGKEDQTQYDSNMSKVTALASDIKKYIKSMDDIKNMSPEEIIFYKVFLISVNKDDTKYLTEIFNRQTSLLKENGLKLDKRGQVLITTSIIHESNRKASGESYKYSVEGTPPINYMDYEKMSDVIAKDNRINLSTNPEKDYENVISSICRSLYEKPDDTVWLNKLNLVFSNGTRELTEISKNMKGKQLYLQKLNNTNISDKLKDNIKIYSKDVLSFQKSIVSYVNCINYFYKYQKIRSNLTMRFNNLAYVYRNA